MTHFPNPGEDFGKYRVTRLLGHGGMGVVYECSDSMLGRAVAVKVLNPMFSAESDFRARFAHEAGVLAKLDSPHIVQIYDYGEIDGCLFLATQLIPDGDLRAQLGPTGFADVNVAINVVAQVCDALADAHARGVIHRDIKTSNVLIRRRESGLHAYLCDFGIAYTEGSDHTSTGLLVGSTAYMAPERHHGSRADERSDIYSVGCLLWNTLTGTAVHAGTDTQMALAHLQRPAPEFDATSGIASELNVILQRALAKNPAERHQSARELGTALRGITSHTNTLLKIRPGVVPSQVLDSPAASPGYPADATAMAAYQPSPLGQPTNPRSRTNVLVGLMIGLLALALIGGGIGTYLLMTRDSGAAVGAEDLPTVSASESTSATSPSPSPTPEEPAPTPIAAEPTPTPPAETPGIDTLGVGYEERNLGCSGEFIVVMTSTESTSPAATVQNGLDRFPRAKDRYYLDPAASCSNLSNLTNKVNLSMVPYMGPFPDAVAACEARMKYADTTTYVIGVAPKANEAQYCACAYPAEALPSLNNVDDAEPRGDSKFWTLELQYMLNEAGYNPDKLVGGQFGSLTTQMVATLQSDEGLAATGAMDAATWGRLNTRVCAP